MVINKCQMKKNNNKKNIYIYQQFVDEVFFQDVAHNHQPLYYF